MSDDPFEARLAELNAAIDRHNGASGGGLCQLRSRGAGSPGSRTDQGRGRHPRTQGRAVMPDTISTEFGDVLAATPSEVILRGRQYAGPEPIDCVVHVARDLYFSAVTAWLDQKAIYF